MDIESLLLQFLLVCKKYLFSFSFTLVEEIEDILGIQ